MAYFIVETWQLVYELLQPQICRQQ